MIHHSIVFDAIEKEKLGGKLCLSSAYHCSERWTKETLEFKLLMSFFGDGTISARDIHERLEVLAAEDFDRKYENENDTAIFVYLTALKEWSDSVDAPYAAAAREGYLEGCEIISQVENLWWARWHVGYYARERAWEQSETNLRED